MTSKSGERVAIIEAFPLEDPLALLLAPPHVKVSVVIASPKPYPNRSRTTSCEPPQLLVAPTLSVVQFSYSGLTALRSGCQLTAHTAGLTWANTNHGVVRGPYAPTVALVSASTDRVQALMAMPLDELWALLVAPPVAVTQVLAVAERA